MLFRKIRAHPFWAFFGLVLAIFFAQFIHRFIGTIVFGVFFYYVSRPFYRRFQPYIPYRGVTAGLSLIIVTLPLFGLLSWLTIAALREYRLVDEQLDIAEQLEPYIGPAIDLSAATSGNFSSIPGSVATLQTTIDVLFEYVSVFGIGATHLLLMIIIAFYLLRDDHRLSQWLRKFDNDSGFLSRYMEAVDEDLHHIFFGNILNAVFAGVLASIIYLGLNNVAPPALHIPYPVLLGSLVGVASLIPIVGMKIAYFPVAGYLYAIAAVTPGEPRYWFPTMFLVSSVIIIDGIPDFILRPYVSGKNTHMGMLMGAYILGPFMFGWYGLFLAPMLLVFVIHYSRIMLPEFLDAPEAKQTTTATPTPPRTTASENTDTPAVEESPTNPDTVNAEP